MAHRDDFSRILRPASSSTPAVLTGERRLIRMRPSARRLLWSALALVLITGSAGYGLVVLRGTWAASVVAGAAILGVLLLVILPALRWASRRMEISSTRVVVRSGLVTRSVEEILLSRCTGIVVRRTWFQAIARCADIHLRSLGGEAGVLRDVPYPRQTSALLRELIEGQRTVPGAGSFSG